MDTLLASTMGPILAGLLIGSPLPAGLSPTHPPSPSVLFSQVIESNPKPPSEQKPMRPLEEMPSPPTEKDAKPPTEDKEMRPLEEMPKPRIEENPSPPNEKQSMRQADRLA